MPFDTTLLDLDRAPTILEMRAFFKKHDWSAAKVSEPKSSNILIVDLDDNRIEIKKHIQNLLTQAKNSEI